MRKITKKAAITIVFIATIISVSCSEEMLPAYMVDTPKILGFQIDEPEVAPEKEAKIKMKILVGGKNVDQKMENKVEWFKNPGEVDSKGFEVPYNQPLEMVLNNEIFQEAPKELLENYEKNGWIDFPVTAGINIDGKNYNTMKILRITKKPLHKNPGILSVFYKISGMDYFLSIEEAGSIIKIPCINGELPESIGFSAKTKSLEETENERHIFRWFVSLSKTGDGRMYLADKEEVIEKIMGKNIEASNLKQAAVFKIEEGLYDFYLIVRDKAENSTKRENDRLGQEFFYFTVDASCN